MEPTKSNNGALIGSIIIVIILILGGLYVWSQKEDKVITPITNENNDTQTSAIINAYNELENLDTELADAVEEVVDIEKLQ